MERPLRRRSFLAGLGAGALLARTGNAVAADWQSGASADWERVLAAARTVMVRHVRRPGPFELPPGTPP